MLKHQILILYLLYPVSLLTYNQNIGLEGKHLTLKELELLKKNKLPEKKELKKALFWHQTFPTTGLRLEEPFYPPAYPFIPHYFSLWQLAPKKGAGITIAVLDTGVAAYQLKDFPEYKKNHDLIVQSTFDNQSLNMVADQGKEPMLQLLTLVKKHTDIKKYDLAYLENAVPQWIKKYLADHDERPIKDYLLEYGNTSVVKNNRLTKEGQKALKDISEVSKQFTLATITKPKKETVILEFLPIGKISDKQTTFIAGHGSHTFGLISGELDINADPQTDSGIVGLAPAATTFMIKAFHDSGVSRKSTLIAALKKAILHDAQVINCSLKVADSLDFTDESTKMLEDIVNLVPYMVAASGNHGDPKDPRYAGNVEAYPARFSSVPFDVGAFSYKDGKAFIPNFSQYEPNVGPLFVAPGFDILSSGLVPGQKNESTYVFMGGTSVATPIMTGFIALILGEFQEKFSREQMLKVCYCSTLKLENSEQWKQRVMLGVVDMRTALFVLHALDHFKKTLVSKKYTFDSNKHFDALVRAVLFLLFEQPQEYGRADLDSVDFKDNFMEYYKKAQQRKHKLKNHKFFVPGGPNALANALSYVSASLCAALGYTTIERKADEVTISKMASILKMDTIDLFAHFDPPIKKRIEEKLGHNSKKSQSKRLKK